MADEQAVHLLALLSAEHVEQDEWQKLVGIHFLVALLST
jgi:hypothetical protein